MRKRFLVLVLGVLFAMPCVLHAEEVEIQLFEVIGLTPLPGDNPLDDSSNPPISPTRPNNFRATIDGSTLVVSIEEPSIPSANLRVTRVGTNALVVNHSFSDETVEQMPAADSYVIEIETAGGSLIGYFDVE